GNEPTSSSPPGSLERFHEVASTLVMGRHGLQVGYEEVARALFEVCAWEGLDFERGSADPVRRAGDYTDDTPGGCRMDGDPAHLWS
ncbi:MAG: hypothetical protein VCA34_17435, partial [Roseibacillus sp.]